MIRQDREHEQKLLQKKFSKNSEVPKLPLCNKRTPRRKVTSANQKKVDNSVAQIKHLKVKVMYTNCDTVSNKFKELEIAVNIENPQQ